ncbi:MAG: ParB/RepB/Spo0J family partition protein [Candidatus Bathyarchaeia archaeon]
METQTKESIQIKIDEDIQSLIPPLSKEEYERLKKDISQFGLKEPIEVTEEGIILDGHHRFKAILELRQSKIDIPLDFKVIPIKSKSEALAYAISKNLCRRQLSDYNLLLSVYRFLSTQEDRFRKKGRPKKIPTAVGIFQENLVTAICSLTRKNKRTVERFLYLQKHANDELKRQLEEGRIGIKTAYEQLKNQEKKEKGKKLPLVIERYLYISPFSFEGNKGLKEIEQEFKRLGFTLEGVYVRIRGLRGMFTQLEELLEEGCKIEDLSVTEKGIERSENKQ